MPRPPAAICMRAPRKVPANFCRSESALLSDKSALAATTWILSGTLKNCPLHDSFGVIESQETSRHLTFPCQRFDDPSAETKVIRPPMQSRMKEEDRFSPCGCRLLPRQSPYSDCRRYNSRPSCRGSNYHRVCDLRCGQFDERKQTGVRGIGNIRNDIGHGE